MIFEYKDGVIYPPIGTRERCRPPSEKRVVAHNPQRPTKVATASIGYITGHLYATASIGNIIPLLYATIAEMV